MDSVVSKQLTLTDTVNGHQFLGDNFGFTSKWFQYIRLSNLSTGTVEIKFGETDDYIGIDVSDPITLDLKFHEFWLKPSASSTIDAIVSLYKLV